MSLALSTNALTTSYWGYSLAKALWKSEKVSVITHETIALIMRYPPVGWVGGRGLFWLKPNGTVVCDLSPAVKQEPGAGTGGGGGAAPMSTCKKTGSGEAFIDFGRLRLRAEQSMLAPRAQLGQRFLHSFLLVFWGRA